MHIVKNLYNKTVYSVICPELHLSVLLRYTDSDCPFDIFNLFLLTFRQHLHHRIISPSGDVWVNTTRLPLHFELKSLYQAKKISSHIFVC